LIDNASSRPLADSWDISWHRGGRHIRADELGLTAARLRGIKESSGGLLIFVDDDNELAPDFLDQAVAIAGRRGNLGVFGAGILEPEFEIRPSTEIGAYLDLLALRSVSSAVQSGNPKDFRCIPWGAGLCVTRSVANCYQKFVEEVGINAVLDRRGRRLFCGGDDLFSRIAVEIGLEFGVLPELRINHLISASRLNQRHLLQLIHDHSLSHGVLRYLLDGIQPGQTKNLADYASLFLHTMRNGWFSMKCRLAEWQGEVEAARFVSRKRLRPLERGRAYDPAREGVTPPGFNLLRSCDTSRG
jgi:glycosyltransferase involved in cell wall biosynthesis